MAVELDKKFATAQKASIKRILKGRPLYFGIQAKAAKAGKFLVSKKSGEVQPKKVRESVIYANRDAEKNKVDAPPAMGVVTGDRGTLTLHFEKGKARPAAAKFARHFLNREMMMKAVRKVVIKEVEKLPVVPDKSDLDDAKATQESVRQKAAELVQRLHVLGGDRGGLSDLFKKALDQSAKDPAGADDALDEADFLLSCYERLAALETQLEQTAARPGVAANIVQSIKTKRLDVVRQQLDAGEVDQADDNLDIAEQSIINLAGSATGEVPVADPAPAANSPEATQWQTALANISPQVKDAIANNIGDVEKMKTVLAFATEKAGAGAYKDALQSLVMLKRLIDEGASAATDPFQPWQATATNAIFQVNRLQYALRTYAQKLRKDVSDAGPGQTEKINAAVDSSLQIAELLEQVVKVLNVTPKSQQDIEQIGKYMRSDVVVAAEKPNPFKLNVDIASPVSEALDELKKHFAVAT